MNKDSVRIFNCVVDKFLELELNSIVHENDVNMDFLRLCQSDRQHIIEVNQNKARKTYAAWRKRGDEWTSRELEEEYGKCD